ncbi:MAG: prohibitin family protein [Candidatus Zixiibacteriota bacterium]|nr:MAG: prohibitin family protein [candidate division Zixibacteria bacterium]
MRKERGKGLPLLLVVIIALTMVGCGTQVPSGHRGVFYSKFGDGTQMGTIYPEGFTWHLPWNSMFVYKIQTQERKEVLMVLSSDGASIRMEVSVLYQPDPMYLDSLQIAIGRNYYDVAVAPTVREVARSVAGMYKPEEIYSTKREELAARIITQLSEAMADRHIIIQNVLMRDVQIPAKISEAINFKLAADQEAQKMQFTIEKERLEAERKRIEAKGIADFQKIISAGITTSYLKWKGIEATLQIAESPNTKVVIVGNDSGEMPIILGGD